MPLASISPEGGLRAPASFVPESGLRPTAAELANQVGLRARVPEWVNVIPGAPGAGPFTADTILLSADTTDLTADVI